MSQKLIVRRAAALAALVFLLAAGLEAALRLTGFALSLPSDRRNAVRPGDSGKLRILTLGESTTADLFAEYGEAWPRLLERGLNEAGLPTRVYNEGVNGTSSALILLRLPGYIEKYRPDVVISMMGVNDSSSLVYNGPAASRHGEGVSGLRVVKLAKWIYWRLNTLKSKRLAFEPLGQGYAGVVAEGAALAVKEPLPEVERTLRAGIKDQKVLALALSAISVKLRGNFTGPSDQALVGQYSDRAFELYPLHHDTAFWDLHYHLLHPDSRLPEVSRKILEFGPNLSDDLISLLAIAINRHPELARSAVSWPSELTVVALHQSPTRKHYLLLAQELADAGVTHIAMQYPTLPLVALKADLIGSDRKAFENYEKIIFVSNDENFSAALKARGYDALFGDRFRGSWGHSTGLGHRLIADAAKVAVLKAAKAGRFRTGGFTKEAR